MGGLRFYANERFQKGRGIGGLFRAFRSLISPIMKIGSRIGKTALKAGSTIGKSAMKAAKSKTGKMIIDQVKDQAITSGLNIASDALRGNDLQESLNNELNSSKIKAADVLDKLKKRKQDDKMDGSGLFFTPQMLQLANLATQSFIRKRKRERSKEDSKRLKGSSKRTKKASNNIFK